MTEKQELEIEISPNGETKIHIKGIKGKRCLEYVDFFKKLLGEVKQLKHTSEYYEPDVHIHIEGKQE